MVQHYRFSDFLLCPLYLFKKISFLSIFTCLDMKKIRLEIFLPQSSNRLVFPVYFSICFESITQPSFIWIHLSKCYGPSTSTNPNPAAKRGGRSPKLALSLSFTLSCLGVSTRSLNSHEISTWEQSRHTSYSATSGFGDNMNTKYGYDIV